MKRGVFTAKGIKLSGKQSKIGFFVSTVCKINLIHIQPGRSIQNGHIESFHERLRDECLNAKWFRTLNDVRCTLATWREEYNCERPHSSLDYRTPNEFRKALEGRGAMAPLPSQTTTIYTTEKTLVMNG